MFQVEIDDDTQLTNPVPVEIPEFWKKYLDIMKQAATRQSPSELNLHEWWARLLAEKLKLIPPKKAEELKHQIDGMILPFLPDDF